MSDERGQKLQKGHKNRIFILYSIFYNWVSNIYKQLKTVTSLLVSEF